LRAQLVAGLTSDEKKGVVDCTAVQAVAAQFVTPAVLFDVVTRDDEGCSRRAQYRPIVEIVVIPLA